MKVCLDLAIQMNCELSELSRNSSTKGLQVFVRNQNLKLGNRQNQLTQVKGLVRCISMVTKS